MRIGAAILLCAGALAAAASQPVPHPLDPRGRIHMPVGLPDAVDSLKTFVEAEGSFSPGFGTHGVYFWLWNEQGRQLHAPTLPGADARHGLGHKGTLIPWASWRAGEILVRTELCQVQPAGRDGSPQCVAARTHLVNRGASPTAVVLIGAVRGLGPAGGAIHEMGINEQGLTVNGQWALIPETPPTRWGYWSNDAVITEAMEGRLPRRPAGYTAGGLCLGEGSAFFGFDLVLAPQERRTIGLLCPVAPGRRVSSHRWDGVSAWAQFDLNPPQLREGGLLQPAPGIEFYRSLRVDDLFSQANDYWTNMQGRVGLTLPDSRWEESFAAIVGHAALCLNEGAPDVAVANYNVFNRDGVYVANILQKSGNFALAETAIDYFLRHPFNGRVQPEADNPGQMLWIMGEHWRFTRNSAWLARVYPSARKLAAMIRYYRTTPAPHWVWDTSLEGGAALPQDRRKELKPGACDGFNPNYTEAFDIAGLRAAAALAEALGGSEARSEAASWRKLAEDLLALYQDKFGAALPKGYGSYAVLWPCRLYPLTRGPAFEQFRGTGRQAPSDWRYFPLARAHQGLLAGNRGAGWETLDLHLEHEQMRDWYAFDEGGPSGVGGWHHVRTTWPILRNPDGSPKSTIAMPHGWAMAEFHLLLRDALVFEDDNHLVLLSGVPPAWFAHPDGMRVRNLPTHFGLCSFDYRLNAGGAILDLQAAAPGGCWLALPAAPPRRVLLDGGQPAQRLERGFLLPPGTRRARIEF
jgi:hypothetical protein